MKFLVILSEICGWTYFFAWSLSFYPQVILNYKRKSVIGLSFDFQLLNITGYVAYSLFNCLLKLVPIFTKEYLSINDPPIPVDYSDVFFALHGLLITSLTIGQCFYYESGDQKPSAASVGLATVLWLAMDISLILAATYVISWLDMLYVFSYVKLIVTATKYIPQAILNWQRKSTVGWSIINILLDFTGGVLSFLQQSLDAWNSGNAAVFYKNPVKLGLSFLSIFFDILFMIQHYCLYTDRTDREALRVKAEQSISDRTPLTGADAIEADAQHSPDDSNPLINTVVDGNSPLIGGNTFRRSKQ